MASLAVKNMTSPSCLCSGDVVWHRWACVVPDLGPCFCLHFVKLIDGVLWRGDVAA